MPRHSQTIQSSLWGLLEMKLSFDRMDFLGRLLKSGIVTAILVMRPATVGALTTPDFAHKTSSTGVSINSSLDRNSVLHIFGEGNVSGVHFDWNKKILASQEEDPIPPRDEQMGGSS